jgi:hypothetical protein
MPRITISIPEITLRGEMSLAYLEEYTGDPLSDSSFIFLHRVRLAGPEYARGYDAYLYYLTLPERLRAFTHLLTEEQFDLVAMAPSRRRDAEPFMAALLASRTHDYEDVSDHMVKDPTARSTEYALPSAFKEKLTISSYLDLSNFNHLLIVDDVFSSGVTAGAMLLRMGEHGLPRSASVTVAVPIWVHGHARPSPDERSTGDLTGNRLQ